MNICIIIRVCCIFYFLFPLFSNSSINIVLDGVDSKLEYNIRKQLSDIQVNTIHVNESIQNQINTIVQLTLKSLGFYEPKINIILQRQKIEHKKSDVVFIKINLGKPIRNFRINIDICGDGKYDVDYQKVVKEKYFFLGKILNHSDYEKFKSKLYNLAISKGYFDANFKSSKLIVIPTLQQSIWNICFDSGKRYIIEDILFYNNQIKENYLKNISSMYLGHFYYTKLVAELNRCLFNTNWFRSVFISVDTMAYHQKKNLY